MVFHVPDGSWLNIGPVVIADTDGDGKGWGWDCPACAGWGLMRWGTPTATGMC